MKVEKPKRPDCNSCYHFSKVDFNETEGYCRVCKKHLNPQEGLTCEQFEPHSLYCDTDSFVEDCPYKGNSEQYCPYYGKYCECDEEEQGVCDLFSAYKDNMKKLLDTRAIKPEKYAELREQDFDTWLDTILHEIIEQVNFDASEVDMLGGAVWNGECPDGTPYPKKCEREDAYIQCIRTSNQLDMVTHQQATNCADLEEHEYRLSIIEEQIKRIMDYIEKNESEHTCSNFCGNCVHCTPPKTSASFHICDLKGEVIDPDESSCAMFEPPF